MLTLYRSRRAVIGWLWLAAVFVWLAWRIAPVHDVARAASLVAAPFAFLLLIPAFRATALRASSGSRRFRRPTLILGAGPLADCCIDLAQRTRAPALHYVGRLLPSSPADRKALDFLGTFDDLERVVSRHGIRRIVVCSGERRGQLPVDRLLDLKFRGVRIEEGVDFYERMTGRIFVRELRPSQLVFSHGFFVERRTLYAKRVIDVVGSSLGLLLALPLMLLAALVIKLDSPGPVLYSQERSGAFGRSFIIHKFRSMRVDAEADGQARFASVGDPRVTRVGRFLRRSRIDELPQLWNVLRGDMSLVGPRPERPAFISDLERDIPYFRQRLFVKPGVTGWAQVRCPYGSTTEEQRTKLEHDLFYIKNMSIGFDLSILLDTIRVVLLRIGAR